MGAEHLKHFNVTESPKLLNKRGRMGMALQAANFEKVYGQVPKLMTITEPMRYVIGVECPAGDHMQKVVRFKQLILEEYNLEDCDMEITPVKKEITPPAIWPPKMQPIAPGIWIACTGHR